MTSLPLLVGEVFVDVTLTEAGTESKLRLGGVAHAARGFWALNQPFRAAVILPTYLDELARKYFARLGCEELFVLAEVQGAPNITVIADATELADQGYETLLRDEKKIIFSEIDLTALATNDILIFPGTYNLATISSILPNAALHIDAAYDLDEPSVLGKLRQKIETVFMSTSSPLFQSLQDKTIDGLRRSFEVVAPEVIILKENRGGSRLSLRDVPLVESLPAQLDKTQNSVGVGDVFAASYVTSVGGGATPIEAGWRASFSAAAYAQTTYPDLFKSYVQRDQKLTIEEMRDLGGVALPWEQRQHHQIYFAAPDFSYVDRLHLEKALAALTYHNFKVRRPVQENGELPPGADIGILRQTYEADCALLRACALVFAVPIGRDPGTLVEVGIAIESEIPVVIYDPTAENKNTMVIAGANEYSTNLDDCLNAVFRILGRCR